MFDATSPSDLTHDLTPFGSPEVRGGTPSDNDLQRAEGFGRALLSGSEKGSRIVDIFQRSPIRIMFPGAGGGAVEEAVLVNTAGGIAGGDRLECGVTALANASIAVTSQAAEKIYRALNEPARIATKLKACEAAKLAWLPQETIVFNWGRLSRETEIEVSSGAELLALEWLVLGRAAHGEEMVGGHIADSWRVKKDGGSSGQTAFVPLAAGSSRAISIPISSSASTRRRSSRSTLSRVPSRRAGWASPVPRPSYRRSPTRSSRRPASACGSCPSMRPS
jgi:urease accessory protein